MKSKNKKGFTLVEVLVTTFITASLIITIYSVYAFHQKVYRFGEDVGEVIQNGRVILERLTRELRQADEIVTSLGDTEDQAKNEIEFDEGHLSRIKETAQAQGGSQNKIILASSASSIDDYYKGAFVKILSGDGAGEIKEILEYNGTTKEALIKGTWNDIPTSNSVYLIDTSYLYIRYFLEGDKVKRQVKIYFFKNSPDVFVPWNATSDNPENNPLQSQVIDEEVIGEYVQELKFWKKPMINISLKVKKGEKTINWFTKVFGRNL